MCYGAIIGATMQTITHRELRNRSADVLRAVEAGETFQITNHGRIAAVLSPPTLSRLDQLRAAGLVQPADLTIDIRRLKRVRHEKTTQEMIDELRDERL